MFLTKRLLFSVYISCFIALLSCSSPSDKAADVAIQLNMHPDSIQKPQLEDLSYGVHNSQKLDVYLPDSSANNKMIILYVHGGACMRVIKQKLYIGLTTFKKRAILLFV